MRRKKSKAPETINETMLRQIRRKKKLRLYRRIKRMIALVFVIVLSVAYFRSDISKVKSYKVNENQFYTQEEVLKIGDLDLDTYFLTPSFIIEKKLEKNPLIEKADVKKNLEGQFEINITEAKVIGYLNDDEKSVLVQGEGVNKVNTYNNLELPKISGLNDEQLKLLDTNFEQIDKELPFMISEIIQYSESYNNNMVMLVMNDGNRVVSGYNGLYLLNNYKNILPQISGHHICLYLDDISGNIIKQTKCGISAQIVEKETEEVSE